MTKKRGSKISTPALIGELKCSGSSVAFDCQIRTEHPAGGRIISNERNSVKIEKPKLWEKCWKCWQPMGCPRCVYHPICTRCLVITDHDYFVEMGPLSNDRMSIERRGGRRGPPLSIYPQSWQTEYLLAHPDTATVEDQELYDRVKRKVAEISAKYAMPNPPGFHQREKERNRQVEELNEKRVSPADKSDWNNPTITDDDIPF